jgi:hypothetical protein
LGVVYTNGRLIVEPAQRENTGKARGGGMDVEGKFIVNILSSLET